MCKKCDDIITCAVQISLQYLRWVRIIKEMPGSVVSGALCIRIVASE